MTTILVFAIGEPPLRYGVYYQLSILYAGGGGSMSLQFVMGGSGSGRSTWLYHMISREAAEHREKNYIILVPDQFTLETQKTLVQLSGSGGILNVDVLSFHRLAYRVFEEVPVLRKTVLEDMGKMMLLRKVLSEQKDNLCYFKRGLYKPGFLDECKSFFCELMQYAVKEEDFDVMEKALGTEGMMAWKLQDLRLIYHALKEKLGDTYMMAEELVSQLTGVAASIPMLRDSVICLDGFTGFTPIQYELLGELLACCEKMIVTVTTDRTGDRGMVFQMSTDTINHLSKLAAAVPVPIEEPVQTGKGKEKIPYRSAGSATLSFLEENIFSYQRRIWKEEVADIHIRVCRREADEAAYVARQIFWLVREKGYSYDDIAVVTGDIAAYEQPLAREFDRMGIRYFMDYKKSIGANAMAEFITAFMEMYRRNMDYESTFRFLRCGLSPLTMEETDLLENYVIAQGRRGLRSWQQEWKYAVDRIDLVLVNEYRLRVVEAIREPFRELKGGRKTVREFTEILYRLIIQGNVYEKIQEQSRAFEEEGNILLAREYKSIYRLMMELFDEMVELLGSEKVSFRDYEELLSAGISEGLVGFVPPAVNQVMVGDMERSRLGDIKVLFFIGLSDDRVPKNQGNCGILSERERKQIAECGIELAPTPEKESAREQFYLYLTLTKPSELLYLTYPKMGNDGSSKRPSYLIHKIHQMFSALVIEDDEKEASLRKILGTDKGRGYLIRHLADGTFRQDMCWWELAAYYRRREPEYLPWLLAGRLQDKRHTKLSREASEILYGGQIYGSVTRLEQFARCPYAHFIIFGLGLREREQYSIAPFDYGNVFHSAMEHLSHRLEEEDRSWQDLTEEEIQELAGICIDHAVEEYKGKMFHQSKRTEFMIHRMKRIIQSAVWGIWRQMKEGSFQQTASEQKFTAKDDLETLQIPLEENRKMVLGGQIDRVDTCQSGEERLIRIIDYKSGANTLSLDKVYHGLQLQLMVYMAAAMELEEKKHPGTKSVPAAMLYYQMKQPELAWLPESEPERRERVLKELRCTGYVNEEPEVLEKIDRNIAAGGNVIPGSSSSVVPVDITKTKGTFSQYSHVLSTEEFEKLMEHTRKKLEEFGNRIYDGEIGAAPYRMGRECGCDHCGLRGVCGVEDKTLVSCARSLAQMKEEEVWEVLYGRDSVDE